MALQLTSIPDADDSVNPATSASTSLGLLDTSARRRTVLRSVGLAGATAGATVLGWSPFGASAARAETSPTGLVGWDANDCKDAYPNGYSEQRDTTGAYVNSGAACYGGRVMGSTMCDSYGWHRSDRTSSGGWFGSTTTSYRPVSSACGATTTKNAWRWTVNGVTYRCSDGVTTVSSWWQNYSYLSICRAKVS